MYTSSERCRQNSETGPKSGKPRSSSSGLFSFQPASAWAMHLTATDHMGGRTLRVNVRAAGQPHSTLTALQITRQRAAPTGPHRWQRAYQCPQLADETAPRWLVIYPRRRDEQAPRITEAAINGRILPSIDVGRVRTLDGSIYHRPTDRHQCFIGSRQKYRGAAAARPLGDQYSWRLESRGGYKGSQGGHVPHPSSPTAPPKAEVLESPLVESHAPEMVVDVERRL